MTVSSEENHETIRRHNAAVAIAGRRTDPAHAHLSLLAQGHVEPEGVVRTRSEAKVILFSLELCHEVEAGVSACDQLTVLHVVGGGRVEHNLLRRLLSLLCLQLQLFGSLLILK